MALGLGLGLAQTSGAPAATPAVSHTADNAITTVDTTALTADAA